MKAIPFLPAFLVLGSVGISSAEEVVMRDVARHEDLVRVKREELAEGRVAEPPQFVPAEAEDPSAKNAPRDLLSRSDIIAFRGKATLVPKRAILHVPEHLTARVGDMEGCRLVTWTDFYRDNSAWIDTHEVSIAMASGDEGISEDSTEAFSERKKLVVATLMKGPVSVLPLKEPVEPEVDTTTGSASR